MKASKKTKRGVVGAAVLAGVLALGGYALTNVIVFSHDTVAGYGGQTVDALTITNTHWVLHPADMTMADSVSFDVTGVPAKFKTGGDVTQAFIRFNGGTNAASDWYACTDVPALAATVTCDFNILPNAGPINLNKVGVTEGTEQPSVAGDALGVGNFDGINGGPELFELVLAEE